MNNLTTALQEAYSAAGEEMGRQMSASVVAIITEMSSGLGKPSVSAWPSTECPPAIVQIVPTDVLLGSTWIVLVSEGVRHIPLLRGEPSWTTGLPSGHSLMALQ